MYNGGNLISQIHRLTDRKINELLKEFKISEFNSAQGGIIYALWPDQKLSIRQISESTCLAMSSLTTMLKRMEEKGLIETHRDRNDGRSTLVALTDKAKEAAVPFEKVTREMFKAYYRNFSEEEIQVFEGMLQRVLKNMEETK